MAHVDTPQSACRFAVAQAEITPPPGIYHRMWGAATHDRATGVHRPLLAKAMVFQSLAGQDDEQIVVSLDHCLLGTPEMDNLSRRAAEVGAVPAERCVYLFTHTHGAGLMDLARSNLPGGQLIAGYLDAVAVTVGNLIQDARRRARPAAIVYGQGRCDLARQRHFWDAKLGQYVCGFNPQGTTDDTVLVARVTDADSRPLASIVNYACHPTTLAWGNTLVSPDFPGALCDTVQQATGAPCVFIQGASGDNGPRQGFVADPAVADRNGRQLAYAALSALEALPPPGMRFEYQGPVVSGATLGTWAYVPLPELARARLSDWYVQRSVLPLDYRSDLPRREQVQRDLAHWSSMERQAQAAGDEIGQRDARAMVERQTRLLTRLATLPPGGTFPFEILWWRIGGAIWLCLEGEHYNVLQTTLRERLAGVPLVVATLAGGSRPSYLPSADAYGKGIYSETVAVLAPGCLERLIAEFERQLSEIPLPTGGG